MKHGRFDHIEGRNEVKLSTIVIDVRSTQQRIIDWMGQPRNFAKAMIALALVILIVPMLLPIALFPLLMIVDSYSRSTKYLPMRYGAWTKLRDPGQLHPGSDLPMMAEGIMYFGVVDAKDPYERGKHVMASADDLTRHMLVLGTTGSGKSEFLKAMTFNVLCWASGFFVADAKADNKLPTDMYSQARMFGRDYDFLVVNYLLGGLTPSQIANMRERLSNGLQPAAAADADTIVQMTSNMMVKASGDGKSWQERGLNLFRGVARALCYKRDRGELTLSMDVLREYLALEKIEELYIEGYRLSGENTRDWPTPYLGVKSYLEVGLPGFKVDIMFKKHGITKEEEEDQGPNLRGPTKAAKGPPVQSNETFNQHGYRSDQVYPALSLLIDTYAHIFRRRFPEVDMQDVVVNKRICVSLIPSLEKGSQEQESLGKLNLALLRVMMARALGLSVEGDVTINVDAKITASATPFALFLDEFAYQFAEGIALTAAQARSLNFFLCALAQDLEKLTEGERQAEAGAMMANMATKFFMKILGSDKTLDLAQKTLGDAMVPVLTDFEGQRDVLRSVKRGVNYRVEKRPRIERQVLESLSSGFAAFFNRDRAHIMRAFYPSLTVPRVRFPRIHRFLQIPDITQLQLITNSIEMHPTQEKYAIDQVKRVLDAMEPVSYAEIITSDVLGRIAATAKAMNAEMPPIERGIVLYQAGLEALNHAKTSAGILGKGGASGQSVKPGQAAPVVTAREPQPVAAVAAAATVAVATTASTVSGQDAFDMDGLEALAQLNAVVAPVENNAPIAQSTEIDTAVAALSTTEFESGLDFFNNFDPMAAAMQHVAIVKKPKLEVFPEAAALMPEPAPVTYASSIEPTDADTMDGLEDDDPGMVLGDILNANQDSTVATTPPTNGNVVEPMAAPDPSVVMANLDILSSMSVDMNALERMGPEVVGLRQPSMDALVSLEKSLGSTEEEAVEAAATTQKAVATSLSPLDNNQLSTDAADVDLLFAQLENLSR